MIYFGSTSPGRVLPPDQFRATPASSSIAERLCTRLGRSRSRTSWLFATQQRVEEREWPEEKLVYHRLRPSVDGRLDDKGQPQAPLDRDRPPKRSPHSDDPLGSFLIPAPLAHCRHAPSIQQLADRSALDRLFVRPHANSHNTSNDGVRVGAEPRPSSRVA